MLKDFLEGKPLRHPLHPMLVHFPIGLFLLSLLLDLASLAFPSVPNLVRDSFYAMLLGVITTLIAAVPGVVDYTDIRSDHPAKRTATTHLTLNLIVVALYGINLGVRSSSLVDPKISFGPLILSLVGVGLLSVSGYLGGRLVYDAGISVGRAAQLKAAIELGRRVVSGDQAQRRQIKSPADVADLLLLEMSHLDQEQLRTVLLDTKNRIQAINTVYIGSLNMSMVRVGEVFKEAVRRNSSALIVVHNHPSGDATPSPVIWRM